MMVVTKDIDEGFFGAIQGRSNEWRMRAIAGLTTREFYGDDPRTHAWARQHGLSRAILPSEREAWLFGWEWPDYALKRERVRLMDLVIGRAFRKRAQEELDVALDVERYGAPRYFVDEQLDRAVDQELLAMRSEYGQIAWGGGRSNRCGSPEIPEGHGD